MTSKKLSCFISLSDLLLLVVLLPTIHCILNRPFWRSFKRNLLPSLKEDPEFYRKLREVIPPKNETAKKLIENFLRIYPGARGKRAISFEDVVIVMDGSGSVGRCEFNKGRTALRNLVGYEQAEVDGQYAMVTFATGVRKDFDFLPQLQAVEMMSHVEYPGGRTNTQAGLAAALNLFIKGSRGFNSRKLVLLLTDGKSNKLKNMTIPNAEKLKDRGVEMYVVAIGDRRIKGIDEMANMASFPPKNFLFRVKKHGDFLEVVHLAIQKLTQGRYAVLEAQNITTTAC